MSIEGILIGLLAIGIGAAWASYGLKAFTILLPIWAFFAGLLIGASLTVELLGDGFFATVTSWVIALVTGVAFALLSYFIYYAAIVILGATAGYALGAGLLASFGMDGFLSVVVGIIAGVALAIAVLILAVPAVLVVVVSAFSGAAAVVNGALILLGQVKLDDVDAGLMEGLLKYGVVAVVAWLVLAAAGIWYQWRDIAGDLDRVAVQRSSYRM